MPRPAGLALAMPMTVGMSGDIVILQCKQDSIGSASRYVRRAELDRV